jgi:hypothetical protein
MATSDSAFWAAFKSRDDLAKFGPDALLLFALQLRFSVEDISMEAIDSLVEGEDDKKADLVYIDSESGYAVIAQTYMSQTLDKKEAPANKACDLNTAVSWLLNRQIDGLPATIRPHAEELQRSIRDKALKRLYIWYVHNLPESQNVRNELENVEFTSKSVIKSNFPECDEIEIQAFEVGISTLEEWYKSISTPILVSEEFDIPTIGGFEIAEEDWKAYVTSIPAKWLYEQFKSYKTKLFSANVRDYLGSRDVDSNINNAIKQTAHGEPKHFWVYNNGITVLTHEFKEIEKGKEKELHIKGISIINGAQTTGVVGNLDSPPDNSANILVRFITCKNNDIVYNIVRYNNSQNKITAADFRSNDPIQQRLLREFQSIQSVKYLPRRGGHEDAIKRRPNALLSVTAGQALAAFHKDPDIAYHQKAHMWEDDKLYCKYFNEQTTAKHIMFVYSLLQSVEKKKLGLLEKSKNNSLTEIEKSQLSFFRKRGSTFLLASAIARCLETFLNKQIPNMFSLSFIGNYPLEEAISRWSDIVDIASSFTEPLEEGLSDGFKTREKVDGAVKTFQSLIAATKAVNATIYAKFAERVS